MQSDPHDIAVVVFDKPIPGITPATLPTTNALSALQSTQPFISVGYGAYELTNDPGGHQYRYNDVRMVAAGTLNATAPAWLRISMNSAPGNGGTCYGDWRPERLWDDGHHCDNDDHRRAQEQPMDVRAA